MDESFPTLYLPVTEIPLPILANLRSENELPIIAEWQTEILSASFTKLLKLQEDPIDA
jgi:hypothetical protein